MSVPVEVPAEVPQVDVEADDFWWNEFVRRSTAAARAGNLPPLPTVEPADGGPDCGSVIHHRAGRCDCWGS